VHGNDLSVTIPDETWTVEWTITSANEQPRAVVEYAGPKVEARNGQCVDCSDPDAVATSVEWSDLAPEIFFVDADTEEFKTLSGDFTEELGTGLDLSPYSIIDISLHVPTLTIYGLNDFGVVYSWKYDGSEFQEVVSTGFFDLSRIHVDNKNDRFVLGTHEINVFRYDLYLYNLDGTLWRTWESRHDLNSISQAPSAIGTIAGVNYVFSWDGMQLYRWEVEALPFVESQSVQGGSGINERDGNVDDVNNVSFRVVGSAIYQYNPVTENNPSNAVIVAGNAPTGNSDIVDFFDFQGIRKWVGCGGSEIWSWTVNAANVVQNRSTANALTLTCKRPFSTS
jgi:hypothetical protein